MECPPEKFVHISNGILLEEWENNENKIPKELADHFRRNTKKGKFNICFFGSINKTYNLDILIETVISMKRDDLAVTFIGSGMDRDELMK